MSNVKNPGEVNLHGHLQAETNDVDVPLVADNIVELATLVNFKLALTLQLATNQNKQNTDASFAVSLIVRGSNSSHRLTFSENTDGVRKLVRIAAVDASRGSTTARAW